MDEENAAYIYTMKYYPALKKKESLSFVTAQMNLEGSMPSEVRQTQRQPQYHNTRGITYMWNLKKRKKERKRKIQTHRNRK